MLRRLLILITCLTFPLIGSAHESFKVNPIYTPEEDSKAAETKRIHLKSVHTDEELDIIFWRGTLFAEGISQAQHAVA